MLGATTRRAPLLCTTGAPRRTTTARGWCRGSPRPFVVHAVLAWSLVGGLVAAYGRGEVFADSRRARRLGEQLAPWAWLGVRRPDQITRIPIAREHGSVGARRHVVGPAAQRQIQAIVAPGRRRPRAPNHGGFGIRLELGQSSQRSGNRGRCGGVVDEPTHRHTNLAISVGLEHGKHPAAARGHTKIDDRTQLVELVGGALGLRPIEVRQHGDLALVEHSLHVGWRQARVVGQLGHRHHHVGVGGITQPDDHDIPTIVRGRHPGRLYALGEPSAPRGGGLRGFFGPGSSCAVCSEAG